MIWLTKTYMNILSLLIGYQEVVVHVVVEDSVADAELQLLQELHIVHYVEAVEHIKFCSIGHQVLCKQQGVLHDFGQRVHRDAVVIQVSDLKKNDLIRKVVKTTLLTFIFV